jgi:GNAT superfamily N-acetyltransferase
VDGYWHFYNQIDGRRWDLTMSQFETPIGYDDLPSTKEEALSDTSAEQYRLLRQRVLDWQNRSEGRMAHLRLESVVDGLPADFETMRAEARAEGYAFLDRLSKDWASSAMRFDRPGEALLAAYSDEVLAAIGGITIDPVHSDALRMRRFYVRPAFRRAGIGREIAHALLGRALQRVRVVTLNAATKSVPFWKALGFAPEARDGHTHIWRQADPKR